MPVKSLNSAVLKWPEREATLEKARYWAETVGSRDASVVSIRCYGSIADGRWGTGSDLDVLIEVDRSDKPFDKRSLDFTLPDCGVPVDMVVYTSSELCRFRREGRRFIREFDGKSIVLYSARAGDSRALHTSPKGDDQ
ncbi:MAG: hypothetical protein A2176_04885 [Spirochaetes bacterium RBG_13_51_14]|nr:MAG: hypothetical protein A2176_04885 [Spirochaetes bacterium RBG_13_51_14]